MPHPRKFHQLGMYLLLCATFAVSATRLAAQRHDEDPEFNVDAAEITFGGRVQAQLTTSSADGVSPMEMDLRRVRFGADVQVNDLVSGRVQPEFSGDRIGLADAYAQLSFSPAVQLRMGNTWRPFSRIEQMSSLRILPIERGVRIRGVSGFDLSTLLSTLDYSDRDVGIEVRGAPDDAPFGLSYAIGVFRGPLQGDVEDEQTLQYLARIELSPADEVSVGAGWSRRDFAVDTAADGPRLEAGNAFVLDLEYGGPTPNPGVHLVAEAAMGDFDPFEDQEFTGGQAWLGYRARIGRRLTIVEPLIRVSHSSIDDLSNDGTLFTPGLNIYFGGLNRLMFNYDAWSPDEGDSEGSFKSQLQLAF